MNSRAIKDYFRAFRWKKLFSTELFMFYFWMLFGPLQFMEVADKKVAALLIYYCGAVLLLVAMLGISLNPVGLPKLMFLCPMCERQREDYVRTRFWVRFLIPAAMFVLVRAILWVIFPQDIFYLLIDLMFLMGLNGASFMSTTGSMKALEATKDQPRLLKEKLLKGMDVKGLLVFLIGVVAWFIACAGIADGGSEHWIVWAITLAVFVWQVWLTVKMLGYVKYLIPLASDYERMNV